MEGFSTPPAFDPSRIEGQAEGVRANMANPRHEEQLREAERAKRAGKKSKGKSLRGRVAGWFRKRR